jgi:hypothetical protein
MENIKLNYDLPDNANVIDLRLQQKKNFVARAQNYLKTAEANATNALKNEPQANKAVVAVLKANEPTIDKGLRTLGQKTSGDIVQKSVRLYNAAENRKNAVGATLVAVLSNPAVVTAILTLIGFLINKKGATAVANEAVTEPEVESGSISGEEMLLMARRFFNGDLGKEVDQTTNKIFLYVGIVLAVFVILVLYLARKK